MKLTITTTGIERQDVINVLKDSNIEVEPIKYFIEKYHSKIYDSFMDAFGDLQPPIIYKYGRSDFNDSTKGEIYGDILESIPDNKLLRKALEIVKLCTYEKYVASTYNDYLLEYEYDDERLDYLIDLLQYHMHDCIDGLADVCELFDIPHIKEYGHYDRDSALIFIVATNRWKKEAELTDATYYRIYNLLEETFKDFNKWAGGFCYGFKVLDQYGEVYDSCGGFYGYPNEIGEDMADNIDFEAYGWTREEVINLINNTEVKY